MERARLESIVSASKPLPSYQATLTKIAAWFSSKLSIATALGVAFIPFLPAIPPFLAAHDVADPVEVIRTLPVPYLDAAPPAEAAALPGLAGTERPARILQAVARRSRGRREARREPESGALGKAGAGGEKTAAAAPVADPKTADPKAAAPADAKSQAADPKSAEPEAKPPEPDVWSDTEIIAALRDCLRRLAPLGAEIEVAEPVKRERCGAPAPVMLRRLGLGEARVELQPPAMLNCAMVASLHAWVKETLQPAAQELLGSPVVRIRNVSGYVCRNRVGTTFHADRLSEHALANAIDIASFVTADGRTVDVLKQWGPTLRDLRAEQEKAWEAVQEAKTAAKEAASEAAEAARAARTAQKAKQASAKAEAERLGKEAERKKEEVQRKEAEWRKALARTAELQKLGRTDGAPRRRRGDKDANARARGLTPIPVTPMPVSNDGASPFPGPEALFLRRLHKGACGTFGTVLGPEANEAHRNHFHFDLATRRRRAFCQ